MSFTGSNTYKKILSKWLFAVVLLLGIFSYSGLSITTQSNTSAYQVTLRINPATSILKSFSYKQAIQQNSNRLTAVNASALLPVLSRMYTSNVKVKLATLSASYNLKPNICLLHLSKIISSNSGDEPAILA